MMIRRKIRDPHLARQLQADARARGVARRLSATINRHWPEILAVIPDRGHMLNRHHLAELLTALRTILQRQLHADLMKLAVWAGRTAARSIRAAARRHLRREERDDMADEFRPGGQYDTGGGPALAKTASMAADEVLINPPSAFELMSIVGPAPMKLTKLFDVDRIAAQVWQGIADGKDRRAIANLLSKSLNNDMVAARRVARTEGLRVATAVHLKTAEQLGDMIEGYQIHATLDSRTRPEHRARHGTIFYRNPKPGQKGFNEMPQPPVDPGGVLAYNCRCFLTPVFDD
jgi:SPP1 gp7 family putative phage head morphogenesis protein